MEREHVMRLEKSLIYKNFYKDLTERYGEEKAAAIWKYANEELERLASEYEDADNNSLTFVFPPTALYRAIEHYAPGEALEMTRAYGTKTGIRLRDIFRKVTALPGIPVLMWKNMDKIAAKMSDGYDIENLVLEEHLCSLDVKGCPLYDKAKEIGTPEAVQMICCMDKEYMTGFRGIDYKRTKSVAEGDECCDYRLSDSRGTDTDATYTTDISDARWMTYDIPGNIGWMTYLAMLVKMIRDREYGSAAVSAVPAALMITGVAELISERIEGLDRELPAARLYRGFGALTLGGITGIAASAVTKSDKRTKCAMGGSAALCAAFAGLLLRGYKIKGK